MVLILNQEIKDKVILAVDRYCSLASELYGISLIVPVLHFDLRGTDAAVARPQRNLIKFNPILLQSNLQDYLNNTIPHEVAHLVSYIRNGWVMSSKGGLSFHGEHWKSIMRDFGCEPLVYHKYGEK